ncbi:MAG: hypothetical protein U5L08_07275 [Xanthomonadales bacterium]|nr:hypothetical protein [Xanthomonadales bacterium]
MAANPESAPPDSADAVIEGLIQASYSTPGIEKYRPCLRALIQIVPTNSPRLLAAAAVNLELVAQAVPWARKDWTHHYPVLSDLPRVYRLLPGGPTHHEIPHEGINNYPVLAGLRRNTLKHPKDDFVRALLISLAVRIALDPGLTPAERSAKQSEHACIGVLKRFVRSLNNKKSHKKRGPWLDRAAEHGDSPHNFLVALARAVLSAKDPGEELRNALAIDAMQVFGLPPLTFKRGLGAGSGGEPSPPKVTSSPIEDEDAEEAKGPHPGSVSIRQVRVRIQDPDDPSPEAQDEAQQSILFARRNRPSRKPPEFTELRESIRRQMRAQNISSAGDLFLKPHIDVLSGAESRLVAKTLVQEATDALDNQDLPDSNELCLPGTNPFHGLHAG